MNNVETIAVLPERCTSVQVLASFLNDQETKQDREVVNFGLATGETPTLKMNVLDYRVNGHANKLARIEVFLIPKENAEDKIRSLLVDKTAIAYTAALINAVSQDILIARQGASMQVLGKMSTFGGPDDNGVGINEGLALIDKSNFESFREYFLPDATEPLCKSLNPSTSYIACRWKYNLTPASWLRQNMVLVQNPIAGNSEVAQPLDAGPAESTGRVADLSPGLATKLGLSTDDQCIVTIPLPNTPVAPNPGNLVAGGSFVERLVSIAYKELAQYTHYTHTQSPLREEIQRYWEEIGFGDQFDPSEPWSAVFVSWCMESAGASKDEFFFSPLHSQYIQKAMANTDMGTGVFFARRIDAYPPKVGDLIHNTRTAAVTTYDQAKARTVGYPSHSAIVVGFGDGVDGPYAWTIGGNESDTVNDKHIILTQDGLVRQRINEPFICVVENRKA